VQRFVARSLAALIPLLAIITVHSKPAFADVTGGDNPGGTISVGVSGDSGSPGASGTSSGSGSPGGAPVCTYTLLLLNDLGSPPPPGAGPGSWYSVTCVDSSGAMNTQTIWIPNASPPSGMLPVDPRAVALQAENSLVLPRPAINLNPPGASVVNLPTWLWVDAASWHTYSVSATVGSVTATATATPVSVVWSMGDGRSLTCQGPGVAYDLSVASTAQRTSCSYAYSVTSAGQPSIDGNPDDGAFTVTATEWWDVSWSAEGASGGGSLPSLSTASSSSVRVEQVESVNS
jgi:hypothetical protein